MRQCGIVRHAMLLNTQSLSKCMVPHCPADMAPEVIQPSSTGGYDGSKADIWSCGIVLYAMLFNAHPFAGARRAAGQDAEAGTLAAGWEVRAGAAVSPECRALLEGVIVEDPERRMGMAQILGHPWFLTDLPKGVLEMNAALLTKTGQ